MRAGQFVLAGHESAIAGGPFDHEVDEAADTGMPGWAAESGQPDEALERRIFGRPANYRAPPNPR